jgi:antitoxin component YwqK of YwqJK toxin-antitoxin module
MSEFIFGFSKAFGYTITYQIFDYTERDVYSKEYDDVNTKVYMSDNYKIIKIEDDDNNEYDKVNFTKYNVTYEYILNDYFYINDKIHKAYFRKNKDFIIFDGYDEFPNYNYCGPIKIYYLNGQVLTSFYSLNGKRFGEYHHYFSNGNLKSECYYMDGKKNGIFKRYYNNGFPFLICYYIDDKLHGKYIRFYNNGHIESISYYNGKGKRYGKYVEYDVNGQKLKTKRYSKGRDITNNSSNVYTYPNSC